MKIAACTLHQYSLKLARPLPTGGRTDRQGLVLTVRTDTGLDGYGEIAPLPGLHRETLAESLAQLLAFRSQLPQIVLTDDMLHFGGRLSSGLPETLFPSVRFGIEMAIFDVLLQVQPAACGQPVRLPVNALLMAEGNAVAAQAEDLLRQGFTCIKMKVARQPLEKDIEHVTAVLSLIRNQATLRLDANRLWTLPQAVQFCRAVDVSGIDYIEEPTADWTCHADLAARCAAPIALDETLAEIPSETLDPGCYRAAVLKPAVLGGLDKTHLLIRWAHEHRIAPVISSAFESSLAVRMYLAFAQLSGITQTPLGLDTGKWFSEDLLCSPPVIKNGVAVLESPASRPVLNQRLLKRVEAV